MPLRRFLSRSWFAPPVAPIAEIRPPAEAAAARANAEHLTVLQPVARSWHVT